MSETCAKHTERIHGVATIVKNQENFFQVGCTPWVAKVSWYSFKT